jgi:hypothetical protein
MGARRRSEQTKSDMVSGKNKSNVLIVLEHARLEAKRGSHLDTPPLAC